MALRKLVPTPLSRARLIPPASGTVTTRNPSIPAKSSGLPVYTGRSCAGAVAATMAS